MALTPEDVLNKSFTATQFRRGYDEQEVDDFLDEVVVELRRLLAENSDLRRRVDQAGGAVGGEMIDSDGEARMAKFAADVEQAEQEAAARIAKAVAQAEQAEQEAQERVAAAAEQGQQADQAARTVTQVSTPPSGATDAAGVIALAQRLHDEYVNQGRAEHDRLVGEAAAERERLLREGQSRHDELLRSGEERHKELVSSAQEQHDRLIAEARGTHERMITEARERSTGMLAEAQQKRQSVLDDLEREQATMSERIAQLTGFEADYRTRLRSFMERQLQHLQAPTDDGAGGVAGAEIRAEPELEPVPAEDGSR